ncbi:hypothetical protein G6F22_010911 [Rhizopus arrhizus]|nr:hypothetical protein G6F22_010911 [Rhizopus arrhizus]
MPGPPQQAQPGQQHQPAEAAQGRAGQVQQALGHALPGERGDEQEQAFQHRPQAAGGEQIFHGGLRKKHGARHLAGPRGERVVLVEHDHAVAVGHGATVGLQAAVERVERRVGRAGLAVDAGGIGIAFTAQALCIALGLGDQHGAVTVSLGADGQRLFLAFRTQLGRFLLALRAHALVHVVDHLAVGRQVHLLDAQVDHLHAQPGHGLVDPLQLLGDQLAAVAGDQLLQGARVDLVAQRVGDDRGQAGIGDARIPTGGTEVVTHVGDVADGEEVDADVLLLGGEAP